MTPKDKALELTEKFVAPTMDRGLCGYVQSIAIAKQCALIAVDEIVKRIRSVNTMPPNCQKIDDNTKEYWKEVKKRNRTTMTPKEKARDLRDKMYLKIPSVYDPTLLPHYPIAKECALIAVDEILNNYYKNHFQSGKKIDYWQEVKKEIEKL